MATLRTVMGDIPADKMGITYPHEHVTLGYGGARQELGDTFDREATITEACNDIGNAMKTHGVATIVDVTTQEIGRDTDILYAVSERLNVNVVACTGYFAQVNGLPFFWRFMEVQQYKDRMIRDITVGVPPNGVKCGVIKVGIGEAVLQEREEKAFRAAAQVSQEYGLAICVHTRDGWLDEYPAPLQALDIMLKEGATPSKIYMGHLEHIFDNPENTITPRCCRSPRGAPTWHSTLLGDTRTSGTNPERRAWPNCSPTAMAIGSYYPWTIRGAGCRCGHHATFPSAPAIWTCTTSYPN